MQARDELPATIRLRLPSEAPSVAKARHATRKLAAQVGASPDAVGLAVSEAVTNAIVHDTAVNPAEVQLNAEIREGRLEVAVEDRAGGMRSDSDGDGLGLGLSVIRAMTSSLAILAVEGGTRPVMGFECGL